MVERFPIPSTVSSYTINGNTGTYTEITGTTLSSAIGDDVGVGNFTNWFGFPYNGSSQTVFGVCFFKWYDYFR